MTDDALRGTGVLIVDGKRHKGAQYQMSVTPIGGGKLRATGVLAMERIDAPAMLAASVASFAHLELKGGEVIQIAVSHMRMPSDRPSFEFVAAGPIPGFD